jgi:hypothetical protein
MNLINAVLWTVYGMVSHGLAQTCNLTRLQAGGGNLLMQMMGLIVAKGCMHVLLSSAARLNTATKHVRAQVIAASASSSSSSSSAEYCSCSL